MLLGVSFNDIQEDLSPPVIYHCGRLCCGSYELISGGLLYIISKCYILYSDLYI